MESMFIIGISIFIIAAIFIANWWHERKRRQAMTEAAKEIGYLFSPKDGVLLDSKELSHLPLMKLGHSRKLRNIISKETVGSRVAVFDYQYTEGSGKSSTTYDQTVYCLTQKDLTLPFFWMEPEGFFSKICQYFGYEDIDFDSHPKFSDAYLLKGDRERAVRKLFDHEVLDFMEKLPGLHIQGCENHLIIYDLSESISPRKLEDFIATNSGIAQVFLRSWGKA